MTPTTTEVRPATYAVAMTPAYADAMGYNQGATPRTCGDEIARILEWRDEGGDADYTDRQRAHTDARLDVLRRRDPEERLWTLTDALTSDELTDEQKFVVRWQHRSHLDCDDFERGLFDALTYADSSQLVRLAAGFPVEVRAIGMFRGVEGFTDTIRAFPIHFTL